MYLNTCTELMYLNTCTEPMYLDTFKLLNTLLAFENKVLYHYLTTSSSILGCRFDSVHLLRNIDIFLRERRLNPSEIWGVARYEPGTSRLEAVTDPFGLNTQVESQL